MYTQKEKLAKNAWFIPCLLLALVQTVCSFFPDALSLCTFITFYDNILAYMGKAVRLLFANTCALSRIYKIWRSSSVAFSRTQAKKFVGSLFLLLPLLPLSHYYNIIISYYKVWLLLNLVFFLLASVSHRKAKGTSLLFNRMRWLAWRQEIGTRTPPRNNILQRGEFAKKMYNEHELRTSTVYWIVPPFSLFQHRLQCIPSYKDARSAYTHPAYNEKALALRARKLVTSAIFFIWHIINCTLHYVSSKHNLKNDCCLHGVFFTLNTKSTWCDTENTRVYFSMKNQAKKLVIFLSLLYSHFSSFFCQLVFGYMQQSLQKMF